MRGIDEYDISVAYAEPMMPNFGMNNKLSAMFTNAPTKDETISVLVLFSNVRYI